MPHLDARLRPCLVALSVGVALFASVPAVAQQAAAPSIIAPADGQVLQGQVSVKGSTDIPDFSSAELAFTYATEPNASWFVIQTASLPVSNAELMVWDTTSISDGDYILRLRVLLLGGGFQDARVNVQVRNYTATVTSSLPAPSVTMTEQSVLQVPTALIITASETPEQPVASAVPTPSPLPGNPAGVTPSEVSAVFWRGALGVGLVLLLFGAFLRLRRY
ncbi:MAG: hypothetical protein ACXWNQ_01995 [Anaerolineales bacterium]